MVRYSHVCRHFRRRDGRSVFSLENSKFFKLWHSSGFSAAKEKAGKHKKEVIEGIGFALLIAGLVFESIFATAARTKEGERLATVGVTVGQLFGYVTEAEKVAKDAQDKVAQMQAQAQKSEPPIPAPIPVPIPVPHTRQVTAKALEIIRTTVRPRAVISIIPYLPGEPERFAEELAAAFRSSNVQVAVGHGNLIMNGTTGLYVQYDHGNPVSKSVFDALVKAGFNPTPGPDTPGDIVFIKIAPAAQ